MPTQPETKRSRSESALVRRRRLRGLARSGFAHGRIGAHQLGPSTSSSASLTESHIRPAGPLKTVLPPEGAAGSGGDGKPVAPCGESHLVELGLAAASPVFSHSGGRGACAPPLCEVLLVDQKGQILILFVDARVIPLNTRGPLPAGSHELLDGLANLVDGDFRGEWEVAN